MDFETTYKVQLTTTDGNVFYVNDAEDLMVAAEEVLHLAAAEGKLPKTYEMFKVTAQRFAGRVTIVTETL